MVRYAWPDQCGRSGYGLENVATDLNIRYSAHRAVEDARAAGKVLLAAMNATDFGLEDWLARVRQPIHPSPDLDANKEGPLYGHVIAFTGALQMSHREASALAANAGCVISSLTKNTTLLIVGDQDIQRLAGHQLSSKHRKAQALISKGQRIRILSESDFLCIVSAEPGETT